LPYFKHRDLRSNAVAIDDATVVDAMKRAPKRRESRVERQIKTLQKRVGLLERALEKAKDQPASLSAIAKSRDDSEREAKRKALSEYYKQREIERYLRNPGWLRAVVELENDRNAFLTSRGFAPEPSDIPEQFRRGLKKYGPKGTPRSG
jgi:hypothetical protein